MVVIFLNNSCWYILKISALKAESVVSDEAGQCLGEDHCIALMMASIQCVVLISDPDQLPPTLYLKYGSGAKVA
jgi:hypothetical protein